MKRLQNETMVGSSKGVHHHLYFEYKEFRLAEVRLKFLSNFLDDIDKEFGSDWSIATTEQLREGLSDKVWTYGMGITFRDLNETEYKKVRKILKENYFVNLSELEKDSSITNLRLKGRTPIGQVVLEWESNIPDEPHIDTEPVELDISFEWGLPDSCEIIETVVKERLTDENYVVENGKQYRTSINREVKCSKPMLQSVFDAQKKREADATMVD